MKESTPLSENSLSVDCLISQSYIDFHTAIYNYIKNRINNAEDAADLAQDSYVRLLDYKAMLRQETVKSFVFTIARNLVIDYIRRHYRKQEVSANMYEFSKDYCDSVENELYANDLLKLENGMMMTLPKQDFEDMLERAAERGARHALHEVGLDGADAAHDIRELRNLLDAFNEAKKTAGLTIVKMLVTGMVLALMTGSLIKLKLFGGAQ